jgi:hypothetical protein
MNLSAMACLLVSAQASLAGEAAVKPPASTEENLRQMDKDKDGMVSVHEVRAALEARHGKDYEKTLLDELEATAGGRSCSTPFSQNFY